MIVTSSLIAAMFDLALTMGFFASVIEIVEVISNAKESRNKDKSSKL